MSGSGMRAQVGDRLPSLEVGPVRPEPMKVMALLLRDSNPIHFDPDVVRRLGLGERPVNQGPINVGYVLRMLAAWAGAESAVRNLSVRFRGNVVAGDRLVAGGQVTGVGRGEGETAECQVVECQVVECDVWLDVVDAGRVLTGTAQVVLSS